MMLTLKNELGKINQADGNAASCGERLLLSEFSTRNRRVKRAKVELKSCLKRTLLMVWFRNDFHTAGLRILSPNRFRLGNRCRYARSYSILKFNFYSIHSFVNLIAMFCFTNVESRYRYAGAASVISGHVITQAKFHSKQERLISQKWLKLKH